MEIFNGRSVNDYPLKNIDDENLINLLVDRITREIIFIIQKKPKSIKEISKESKFSINTVYRRIQELKKWKVLKISGNLDKNGKRQFFYQSKIYSFAFVCIEGKSQIKIIYNDLK